MQYENREIHHPGCVRATMRRVAIIVSSSIVALSALALPPGMDGAGPLPGPAFAAGDGENAAGPSEATGNVPGAIGRDGKFAMEDESVESSIAPAANHDGSAPKVIKEVAGVAGETELSVEEELEAIRNGWGTWRTADGPESVIAQ